MFRMLLLKEDKINYHFQIGGFERFTPVPEVHMFHFIEYVNIKSIVCPPHERSLLHFSASEISSFPAKLNVSFHAPFIYFHVYPPGTDAKTITNKR